MLCCFCLFEREIRVGSGEMCYNGGVLGHLYREEEKNY